MSKQMEVIINIISSYLAENRRITVPSLGAFLTKGDGVTILFSEFMKGDDGVLRDLLRAVSGVSDEEASSQIDRFVEEVRSTLRSGERFDMGSLGALVMDGETIQLVARSVELVESIESIEPVEQGQKQVVSLFDLLSQEEEDQDDEAEQPEVPIEAAEPQVVREPQKVRESRKVDKPQKAAEPSKPKNTTQPKPTTQRPKYDVWLVSAIAAGLFALFALLYGLIVEWQIGNISFGGAIDDFLYGIFG